MAERQLPPLAKFDEIKIRIFLSIGNLRKKKTR